MGLLVLNEMYDEWVFPKRKWIEGWNVGTPGFQGSYDIFKEWSEIDLADLVNATGIMFLYLHGVLVMRWIIRMIHIHTQYLEGKSRRFYPSNLWWI